MLSAGRYVLVVVFVGVCLVVSFDINDSTLLKQGMLFIGCSLLAGVFLSNAIRRGSIALVSSSVQPLVASYIIVCSLSLVMAINVRPGEEYLLQLACFFIVLTTALNVPGNNEEIRKLIAYSIAAVALISCAVALLQIIPNVRFGIMPVTMVRETVSTFGNRAYFAGFLALALPIILSNAVNAGGSRNQRTFFFATASAILFFIIKSESRSAWIATIVSLILFAWINYRTTRARLSMLAFVLLTFLIGFFVFPELLMDRIRTLFHMDPSSSVYRRLFFYEGAWKAFLASPLLGHGIGNFSIVLPKYRSPNYWMAHSEDVVPHAHNEILEILAETGLAGFLCVLLAGIYCVRTIRTSIRASSGNDRAMLVGYLSALVAVCIENLTDMTLRTIPVAFSFSMVLGLSLRAASGHSNGITFTFPGWTRKLWMFPMLILPVASAWIYGPAFISRHKAEEAFLQGIILRASNRTSESIEQLSITLANDPSNAVARLYLASNLAQENRFREARDHITLLLRDYPYYPKARIVLAPASFELGDTTAALREIRDELAIESSPQATYNAAYLSHRAGKGADERLFLQTLLANAIKSADKEYVPEALRGLSQLCGHEQGGGDCQSLARSVAEEFWMESRIVSAAGGFFATMGMFDDAESLLQRARTLDPKNEEVARNLQFVHEELNRIRSQTLKH